MPVPHHIAIIVALALTFASPAIVADGTLSPDSSIPFDDASVRVDFELLDAITQPISTVSEYADGRIERNNGYGFIAGSRFITVNHNLESATTADLVGRTSYVDGIPLKARLEDAVEDLAIFDLPPPICSTKCNDIAVEGEMVLRPGQHLFWLRKAGESLERKVGAVVDYAWIGRAPAAENDVSECPGNLIVRVDAPFLQGSSGSPIVDSATGRIVGVIQGTLIGATGVERGFFKPVDCLKKIERNLSHDGLTTERP